MIYRIAEAEEWEHARARGFFVSADLAREGFIHCSERHQILATAERYYAGKTGLALLVIDETKIAASVKREFAPSRQEMFPHVFAPIPITAIVHHFDFLVDAEGRFLLPPALAAD